MTYSMGTVQNAPVCCVGKYGTDNASVIYTYGYCTGATTDPAGNDIPMVVARTAAETLRESLDSVGAAEKRNDLDAMIPILAKALQATNRSVYDYGRLLAQRAYVGGGVFYSCKSGNIVIPFGGAVAYKWHDGKLSKMCGGHPGDGIIRDAVGSSRKWSGKAWKGEISPGSLLLFLPDEPKDLAPVEAELSRLAEIQGKEEAIMRAAKITGRPESVVLIQD